MQQEVARSRVSLEPTDGGLSAVYTFAPDLPVFAGHFPGSPLVPGVYLIEAVRQSVQEVLGHGDLAIGEVADARFTAPAMPGQPVRLEVSLAASDPSADLPTWTAKAQVECAGQRAAKLRLRLRAERS